MLNPNFLRKDTKNTSSYHFVSIIPKELRNQFGNRTRFTISLRTGIYRDARSISHKLYAICQIIYQKIRMEELELDVEGIKNILKVEVTRSVRHSEHIKLDVNNDIEKYKSLVKVAEEKEDFKNND